jgi:hypothetical protein
MLLAIGASGRRFLSEAIALVDSETGLVGRSVWTDERGDRVSANEGRRHSGAKPHHGDHSGRRRYAGATGSYEFSWQFVTESDDGSIQGRAVELKGRVRPGQPAAGGLPK